MLQGSLAQCCQETGNIQCPPTKNKRITQFPVFLSQEKICCADYLYCFSYYSFLRETLHAGFYLQLKEKYELQ